MNQSKEQQLVDICFQLISTSWMEEETRRHFIEMGHEKRMEWVATQLRNCGFDTYPAGCSWGVLKK